jgi:hypothetical protein
MVVPSKYHIVRARKHGCRGCGGGGGAGDQLWRFKCVCVTCATSLALHVCVRIAPTLRLLSPPIPVLFLLPPAPPRPSLARTRRHTSAPMRPLPSAPRTSRPRRGHSCMYTRAHTLALRLGCSQSHPIVARSPSCLQKRH